MDWPELAKDAGVHRHGNAFVVSRSRLQNAERIGSRTMHASSDEPHNWGVFLLYVLPAAVHFAENRHAYDKLLVHADRLNLKIDAEAWRGSWARCGAWRMWRP